MRRVPINNGHLELRYNADRGQIEFCPTFEGATSNPVYFIDIVEADKLKDIIEELLGEFVQHLEQRRSKSPWAR